MAARKTPQMLAVEARYGKSIEDVLMDLYRRHGTLEKVGAELGGFKRQTMSVWFARLGLATRLLPEPPAANARP